jgi:hypothetical protein
LHADKIKQIIAVGFLEDAQAVIKTPTDKSAEAMAKYGAVVKYAHGLGVVSTAVEIGADMYAGPSTATLRPAWPISLAPPYPRLLVRK